MTALPVCLTANPVLLLCQCAIVGLTNRFRGDKRNQEPSDGGRARNQTISDKKGDDDDDDDGHNDDDNDDDDDAAIVYLWGWNFPFWHYFRLVARLLFTHVQSVVILWAQFI